MQIAVVTLFPEMFKALTDYGISSRAVNDRIIQLSCVNPRDFATDKHRTVDDKPFGGGPGMLMKTEPLKGAIQAARQSLPTSPSARVILLSPQGRKLDQHGVTRLAQHQNLVLVCGRYQGIDERLIEDEIDEEWSIGDYVISGGELAAMVMIDALTRLQPGALGSSECAELDSFSQGLLHSPQYTRPQSESVPQVLLSGDHEKIHRWRLKQSLGATWRKRPDLLESITLSKEQRSLLAEYIEEHKVAQKH
jgi:tRNA (guanine37-N1)-methyltransferase